jgi:pentatricopeptide repeat protein
MLPKVATHILHSTTRAAAAVQNQTHAIRNVLQLQSSGPSSGSGSSWGNGPGPGGAKYNTGSRFHAGYNGAGRAVTQANVITSQDGTFTQSDDTEEFTSRRSILQTPKRPRIRSSSVSLSLAGRRERGEKLGVLKTVQLHARSRHAFGTSATAGVGDEVQIPTTDLAEKPARSPLVRRNSTSSEVSRPSSPVGSVRRLSISAQNDRKAEAAVADLPTPPLTPERLSTDPAAPQTVLPPQAKSPVHQEIVYKLVQVSQTKDALLAADLVREFIQTIKDPTPSDFNVALLALISTRPEGEPLNIIVETYNAMLQRSLSPNTKTYSLLIDALTQRDDEVRHMSATLEARLQRIEFSGSTERSNGIWEKERLESLRAEGNFSQAMALFEAVLSTGRNAQLELVHYTNLIRSCAYHSSVEGAIHVFEQLERRKDLLPDSRTYRYMLQVFTNAGNFQGAEEIFKDFRQAGKEDRLAPLTGRQSETLQTWNQMIETYFRADLPDKAVGILDEMLATTAGSSFGPGDIPPPASSTYTTILSGFCLTGQVQTALDWFDRLLAMGVYVQRPFEAYCGGPIKPDQVAWGLMLDALAKAGMVDDFNRLFKIMLSDARTDGIVVRRIDRTFLFSVNMAHIKEWDDPKAAEVLDFLAINSISPDMWQHRRRQMLAGICEEYVARGLYRSAVTLFGQLYTQQLEFLQKADRAEAVGVVSELQNLLVKLSNQVYSTLALRQDHLPFVASLELLRLTFNLELKISAEHAPYILHSFGHAKQTSELPDEINPQDWAILLNCAVHAETLAQQGQEVTLPNYAFTGLASLLIDIAERGVTFDSFDENVRFRTMKLLSTQLGHQECKSLFTSLGPSYAEALQGFETARYQALEEALNIAPPLPMQEPETHITKDYGRLNINLSLNRTVEAALRDTKYSPAGRASKAYDLFMAGVERGLVTLPPTTGKLIQAHGRLNELDKVQELYTAAQACLMSMEHLKDHRNTGWVAIEDSMIIALAHAGNLDAAHVHRSRILDFRAAPSADAYGALILYVKDTTDDASNALRLFNESQTLGVRPNLYLYNNIISKLSKARKADHSLELFQQMKESGVRPSSITYGAVIGACARVGDVHSAETLFTEMVQAPGFSPRIPPYNTMMQLYTTTKPSRERSLYFYNELLRAGVSPTAHTYKLLLDTYGTLEPVDIPAMEGVFKQLCDDPRVQILGQHFGSLINAYGCVQKDLDKAIEVFDSIPSYGPALADAVVFEALINALVAHRRMDLMPEYISKMTAAGVHMTAYIANFLIKGYANVGDMEQARTIFESLTDPPTGVAAPNNHAPHNPSDAPIVSPTEPVYREPSTWEVMVRAELGAGNRDKATDLLERLRARQYPEAVYNRISGVMVDHSQILH